MSIEDRTRWDDRHRRRTDLKPRPSVLEFPAATSPDALALDLACGQGRHALTLRRAGYRVIAMDVSRQALQRTVEAHNGQDDAEAGRLLALQADADAWPFRPGSFDAIVQVDFLDRTLFPHMLAGLRRGGWLLVDTFLDRGHPNVQGPSRTEFLLAPGELPRAFRDLDIRHYQESDGLTARAVMLARLP